MLIYKKDEYKCLIGNGIKTNFSLRNTIKFINGDYSKGRNNQWNGLKIPNTEILKIRHKIKNRINTDYFNFENQKKPAL